MQKGLNICRMTDLFIGSKSEASDQHPMNQEITRLDEVKTWRSPSSTYLQCPHHFGSFEFVATTSALTLTLVLCPKSAFDSEFVL
jgi:hypothetical protein